MKNALRKEFQEKRKCHALAEQIEKSGQIKNRLQKLEEYEQAETIAFYVSKDCEVRTDEMISDALSGGKRVLVPKVEKKNKSLALYEIKNLEELELGEFGVREPKEGALAAEVENIDLMVVPGIAFDTCGNRVGYGVGYYDKLLKKIKRGMPVMGLAYGFQIVEKVDKEEHDVAVDFIITEKEVIRCQK